MGLTDKHDSREFEHFAKIDDRGVVVAIVERALGSPPPDGDDPVARYVKVTDQYPHELHGARLARARAPKKAPRPRGR